jgi:hypothetical protein
MAEFVKFLRNPDRPVTFASAGIGTPGHLAGELLKLKLNNDLTHAPYKGAAPALNDVVGGHVDFYFPGFPAAVPLMQGCMRRRGALNLASEISGLAAAGRSVSHRCPIRSPPVSGPDRTNAWAGAAAAGRSEPSALRATSRSAAGAGRGRAPRNAARPIDRPTAAHTRAMSGREGCDADHEGAAAG